MENVLKNILVVPFLLETNTYDVEKNQLCLPFLETAHVLLFLLLGEQECPSCKIFHMENVLKNILVVPFLSKTITRDVEKTSCVSPS